MTTKEQLLIRKAIGHLTAGADHEWQSGMDILLKLIDPGYVNPLSEAKAVSVKEAGQSSPVKESGDA